MSDIFASIVFLCFVGISIFFYRYSVFEIVALCRKRLIFKVKDAYDSVSLGLLIAMFILSSNIWMQALLLYVKFIQGTL